MFRSHFIIICGICKVPNDIFGWFQRWLFYFTHLRQVQKLNEFGLNVFVGDSIWVNKPPSFYLFLAISTIFHSRCVCLVILMQVLPAFCFLQCLCVVLFKWQLTSLFQEQYEPMSHVLYVGFPWCCGERVCFSWFFQYSNIHSLKIMWNENNTCT